ncbi:SDR family NAD(P)-dependent oxidoreductase [Aurantivibrio plasticivorans]
MKSFSNKTAAITGAGSGIGRALAIELATHGCQLALSDINMASLQETQALLGDSSIKVSLYELDVANQEAVQQWADHVYAEHGQVNLLFNNAGVTYGTLLEDLEMDAFEWLMGINFWGVVYGTQAFLPYLKKSGDGHVVNISSLFGLLSMPQQGCYNAAKFAVRGYTEALRMELEMEGVPVSVTCVHPGGIATNIAHSAKVNEKLLTRRNASVADMRQAANAIIQGTQPKKAAQVILKGVQKNRRRVLIGKDAWILDKIVRLLGSWYQPLIIKAAHLRNAGLAKPR